MIDMEEEEKEEDEGPSLGALFTAFSIVMIVTVGFVIYQVMSEPYRTADELRDVVNNQMNNISDEYKEGWLDCVDYYLKMKTEATNVTSDINYNFKEVRTNEKTR